MNTSSRRLFVPDPNGQKRRYVLDHGMVRLCNIAGPVRRMSTDQSDLGIDRDFDADDRDPAIAARLSFEDGEFGVRNRVHTYEQDLGLAEYLLLNEHTSPWEMIQVWLEVKVPIFVDRQMVRYRTWKRNESSARYIVLPATWYIPEVEDYVFAAKNKKQGGTLIDMSDAQQVRLAEEDRDDLRVTCARSWCAYERSLARGIAPEQARIRLHLNHYVHWLGSVDLSNMFKMLRQRTHSHAQGETSKYAWAIVDLLRGPLPGLMQLFDKHVYRKS